MYTIKRYANGRFYDTEKKTFVRREQIARMVADEKEFVIVDTKTGNDITEEIISRIQQGESATAGRQKASASGSSRHAEDSREDPGPPLLEFFRKSSDSLYQWGRKYAAKGQDLLAESWRELDKRVNRLVAEKKLSESEGRDLKEEMDRHSDKLRGWIASRMEQVIEDLLREKHLVPREEMDALEEKLQSLEKRLARLENKQSGRKS